MVRLAAERGLGKAELLSYQVIDALEAGRLCLHGPAGVEVPVQAVHSGTAHLPSRVRLVFDALVAALRAELGQQARRLDRILDAGPPRSGGD